jgi:Tol biopolymer transport system component
MRKTTLLILVGFGLLLSLDLAIGVNPQTQSAPAAPATIKEELLFEADPALEIFKGSETVSINAWHVAFKAKSKGKWLIALDGKPGPEYEDVGSPALSPSGERLAYAAKRAKKWVMVVDGKEQGLEFENMGTPHFSPDGQRLTYRGWRRAGWSVVLDGQEGPPFYALGYASFSPDSKHFAYTTSGLVAGGVVVVDGKEMPRGSGGEAGAPIFSPDSQHLAYRLPLSVKPGFMIKTRWVVMLDGKQSPLFEDVAIIHFSPDSKHIAYAAKRGKDDWCVMLDEQPGPKFEAIVDGPVFSPDGKHIAYVAWDNKKMVEVRDGQKVREAPSERGLNFVEYLKFSDDSKRLLYVIGRGGVLYIMAQEEGKEARARRRVIADGQEGKVYDAIDLNPQFSPDSRRVAILVHGMEKNKDMIAIDGQEGKVYDLILRSRFISNDAFEYIARQGQKFYRVTQSVQ